MTMRKMVTCIAIRRMYLCTYIVASYEYMEFNSSKQYITKAVDSIPTIPHNMHSPDFI